MACPKCRTWNTNNQTCVQVRCLACDTEQCHSHGRSNGSCKHCHYGMLPGWSRNNNPDREGHYPLSSIRNDVLCSYKGCGKPAVYGNLPGQKQVACQGHGDKVVARQKERRAKKAAQRRLRWAR